MPHPHVVSSNQPTNGCNNTTEEMVGGFLVGDRVSTTPKKGTHHRRLGVVSKFCANGSTSYLWVRLEESPDVDTRFKTCTLQKITSIPVVTPTVAPTPDEAPVSQVTVPMEEATVSPATEASTKISTSSKGSRMLAFARKVLDTYRYAEFIRESIDPEAEELRQAMRHLMDKIRNQLDD
jgi:hypothetical protein